MKKLCAILLATALLSGCAAAPTDAPTTQTTAATQTTATPEPSKIAAPSAAPQIITRAECASPYPWALSDGTCVVYVDDDGLHRMNRSGTEDQLLLECDSGSLYGVYALENERLLVQRRVPSAQENELAMDLPEWMYDYTDFPAVYDLVLLNAEGEPRTLASGVHQPVYVSESLLVCQRADGDRSLLAIDLKTETSREAQGLDLSSRLILQMFADGGTIYFRALEEGQEWEAAPAYAFDPVQGTVRELSAVEMPNLDQAEPHTPSRLAPAQVAWSGEMEDQTYAYRLGDALFTARLMLDAQAGAATVAFYVGDAQGELLRQLDVRSLYAHHDGDEVRATGEAEMIAALEQQEGVLYAAYVEQLHVAFAGGWAFLYEMSYTNDVNGGPDRLIAKVNLADAP